jgi:hypothetical protein
MNEIKDTQIKRIFDAFGRRPTKGQLIEYLDWADPISFETVLEIVNDLIASEEKFPSIAVLNNKLRNKNISANWTGAPKENCWYCSSTGYIPIIYLPNQTSTIPFIRNFSCNCQAGVAHQKRGANFKETPRFFDDHNIIKFENESKFEYPFLTENIQRIIIKNYNKLKDEKEWKMPENYWENELAKHIHTLD